MAQRQQTFPTVQHARACHKNGFRDLPPSAFRDLSGALPFLEAKQYRLYALEEGVVEISCDSFTFSMPCIQFPSDSMFDPGSAEEDHQPEEYQRGRRTHEAT